MHTPDWTDIFAAYKGPGRCEGQADVRGTSSQEDRCIEHTGRFGCVSCPLSLPIFLCS
jgi:hypothetical protein